MHVFQNQIHITSNHIYYYIHDHLKIYVSAHMVASIRCIGLLLELLYYYSQHEYIRERNLMQ